MTKLDLNNVALRRDPYTRFEGPFLTDKYGFIWALIEGQMENWSSYGRNYGDGTLDLIPLQTKPEPVKPVHGWVNVYVNGISMVHETKENAELSANPDTTRIAVEVIERAPAEKLAEAVTALLRDYDFEGRQCVNQGCLSDLRKTLSAYREVFPKDMS